MGAQEPAPTLYLDNSGRCKVGVTEGALNSPKTISGPGSGTDTTDCGGDLVDAAVPGATLAPQLTAFFTGVAASSKALEVVDIDGDGDLDIFVANFGAENSGAGQNAMYITDGCPAGAARLSSRSSWCFDCPTFGMRGKFAGGDSPPPAPLTCSLFSTGQSDDDCAKRLSSYC